MSHIPSSDPSLPSGDRNTESSPGTMDKKNLLVDVTEYPDRSKKKDKDIKMILKTRSYYNRDRKNSITSNNEDDMVGKCALENHKKFLKKQDESKRAMKKLFFVSCICFLFMVCEFAGGILSGSLAILADAAHMFSDVAGFMISFFSIYISQRKQTKDHSYGYHRTEILGAFMSIFLIWGLLVWLNWEAVNRIITPPPAINADLMLITAVIGFLCNVTNFVALNCACGQVTEEDDEEEEVEHPKQGSTVVNDSWTVANKSQVGHYRSLRRQTTQMSQYMTGVYKPRQAHNCVSVSKAQSTSRSKVEIDYSDEDEENNHRHEIMAEEIDEENVTGLVTKTPKTHNENLKMEIGISPVPETDKDIDSPLKNKSGLKEGLIEDKTTKQKRDAVDQNMNIRAAVIHILGDMVQSVGVISAAIIIKCRPDWQIADPICTFLFSILVLMTTVPIFMDCVHIVMENTPTEIDVTELYNSIQRLKTVEEIHDFHCSSLAGGKYVMTCHVRSNFGERAVRHINKVCRDPAFGVYHTTVQVEKENRGADELTCNHNQ